VSEELPHEVQCPHCRKSFTSEVIAGRAARYRGFKCPHCRLFVPAERATNGDATTADSDAA
jgi:sarcosine oxidase delta subunit